MRAGFSGHAYDRHRHETYAIGVTEAGLQCFHYRGAARASTPGRVIVIHPDEAHDGHAGAPGGLLIACSMPTPALINAALGGRNLPFYPTRLSTIRRWAVSSPRRSPISPSRSRTSRSQASLPPSPTPFRAAPARRQKTARFGNHNALAAARQLLLEAVSDHHIGAAALEAETGVDRFTLARGFRTRFGTSPHRYLTGRRLERVKAEIVRGAPLAEAAVAAGFADQSHMTRHFKSRFGLTPGRYAVLLRRGVNP